MAETQTSEVQQIPQLIPKHNTSATSQISSQTKIEKTPEEKIDRFASKVNKIYQSKDYAALRPETKQKVDELVYKKYSGISSKYGQKAPVKQDWDTMTVADRLNYIRTTKPNPAVQLSPEQLSKHFEQGPTFGEATKYAAAKMVESNNVNIQNALSLAAGAMRFGGHFQAGAELFDAIGKEYQKVTDWSHKNVERLQTPAINNSMSAKLYGGAAGFVPDIAALMMSPSGEIAGLSKTEKGYELTGAISKAGGITKFLEASPLGRTAVRMAHGAIDGYYLGNLHGESPSEAGKTAASWAVFEGGLPALSKAVSSVYTKLSDIMGPEFVKAGLFKSFENLGQTFPQGPKEFWGVAKDDPLVRKITKLNEDVLNHYSHEFYDAPYSGLKKPQQKQINLEITKSINNGYKYPAIFDFQGTAKQLTEDTQRTARDVPEVASSIAKLEALTKKSTGNPIMQDAVKDIQKRTKLTAGVTQTPAEKLAAIQKASTTEDVAKAIKKENLVKEPKASKVSKQKIVPGAARANTAEFDTKYPNLLKALSLNEYPENPTDQLGLMYMNVQRGYITGSAANKVVRAYEEAMPDPQMRWGHQEGLKEHLIKLFHTDHLGKGEHIFRSGNYMHDDLRDLYNLPKTDWQEELDEEYKIAVKGKK